MLMQMGNGIHFITAFYLCWHNSSNKVSYFVFTLSLPFPLIHLCIKLCLGTGESVPRVSARHNCCRMRFLPQTNTFTEGKFSCRADYTFFSCYVNDGPCWKDDVWLISVVFFIYHIWSTKTSNERWTLVGVVELWKGAFWGKRTLYGMLRKWKPRSSSCVISDILFWKLIISSTECSCMSMASMCLLLSL